MSNIIARVDARRYGHFKSAVLDLASELGDKNVRAMATRLLALVHAENAAWKADADALREKARTRREVAG